MSDEPHIRLLIRSNPLFLSGARELVFHVAKRLDFPEEACGQLALALDEAICNVIRHGYNRELDRPIWISLYVIGDLPSHEHPGAPAAQALKLVIEDEARQVDLATIKSRDLDEIRPGGLGVHIINEVMDEVKYEHRQPVGMRLTMVKKKKPAGSPAHSAASRQHAT